MAAGIYVVVCAMWGTTWFALLLCCPHGATPPALPAPSDLYTYLLTEYVAAQR
jgi:hypothetical protein